MACCKSCARSASISGIMKRKKGLNIELLGGLAVGGATGGIAGGLIQKIPFVAANERSGLLVGAAKAGIGYYLMENVKSDFVQAIGMAWIADGGSDLAAGFGLAGFRAARLGPSYYAHHNRKHNILGHGDGAMYRKMGNRQYAQPMMAKVI